MIGDSMKDGTISFADSTIWKLGKQLSEKPWAGCDPDRRDGDEWDPSGAHAVYECVQIHGPQPNKEAIMKIRIE